MSDDSWNWDEEDYNDTDDYSSTDEDDSSTDEDESDEEDDLIVYRRLRQTEDPTENLTAKDPQSDMSVKLHVLKGTRSPVGSKYISTCKTWSAMELLSNYDHYTKTVVKIDLGRLLRDGVLEEDDVIDLTDPDTLDEYIHRECIDYYGYNGKMVYDDHDTEKAREFATKFDEILLIGEIPSEYVDIIGEM